MRLKLGPVAALEKGKQWTKLTLWSRDLFKVNWSETTTRESHVIKQNIGRFYLWGVPVEVSTSTTYLKNKEKAREWPSKLSKMDSLAIFVNGF